eukprot:TRINITY_DN920_c0_g1_i12.p1 TRINITY_DN920_c0_g1~~TRINITY_DN920_c0_g1_i12.p1  ORF type:complete len:308 (+),score=89.58 TRINITY_DN920_c0_g1_i12:108-926(+)
MEVEPCSEQQQHNYQQQQFGFDKLQSYQQHHLLVQHQQQQAASWHPAYSLPQQLAFPGSIYLPINVYYPGVRQLHGHPPFYVVEGFLSTQECEGLIREADGFMCTSPVVGKGNGEISPSRTSTSCYFAREDLPSICHKVCMLTGKPADHLELPQVGRYLPTQFYAPHLDAFDLKTQDGMRFAQNGGQRVATVLIYLNDVPRGGNTSFPRLGLSVSPRRGMAVVFFPSTLDGCADELALHTAEPAVDVKYVSQIWIRQGPYTGEPTRRLLRNA